MMVAKMLTGGRKGNLAGIRRLVALAMAQELEAFVVPGAQIARAHGLDLAGAGLPVATTPRHSNVLLLLGDLPADLLKAAAIVFAQMPRPRAILALGSDDISPLPAADVQADLSRQGLREGLTEMRKVFSAGAFQDFVEDFDAQVLAIRIEYTCPMHPEIVRDEPGSCPKCGMNLVPREAQAGERAGPTQHVEHSEHGAGGDATYTCPMHPEIVRDEPGSCPKCGMNLVPRETEAAEHSGHEGHSAHGAGGDATYTCPMHPEVESDEPGSCPKCGMNLVPREAEAAEHSGHSAEMEHGDHGDLSAHEGHGGGQTVKGIEPQFMSMIDITKDLPRSSDGLQMDWIKVPFGPFFPGLPGGLGLEFTLDGDTVVNSVSRSVAPIFDPLVQAPMAPAQFKKMLENALPGAKAAYGLLVVLALESAAEITPGEETATARAAALERERIASHLSWLADFGAQSGFGWLAGRAAALQLGIQDADAPEIAALTPPITALLGRLKKTPLLRMRLEGIAVLDAHHGISGPSARASGSSKDLRASDKTFVDLGFVPLQRSEGDALARLFMRCDEISQSLGMILRANHIERPTIADLGALSGTGEAAVETARGEAKLSIKLDQGKVVSAKLETPSTGAIALIEKLTSQRELGDALTGVVSLDLSPWEISEKASPHADMGGHS